MCRLQIQFSWSEYCELQLIHLLPEQLWFELGAVKEVAAHYT